MKIICQKSNLLKSVSISLKAVPSKTTMPILECILIDATTNQIKFTTNDMELGIETIVDGTIEEKGLIATTEHNQSLTVDEIITAWKLFYDKRNSEK